MNQMFFPIVRIICIASPFVEIFTTVGRKTTSKFLFSSTECTRREPGRSQIDAGIRKSQIGIHHSAARV